MGIFGGLDPDNDIADVTVDELLDEARSRDEYPDLWHARSGAVKIADMETSHIENAMNLLVRRDVLTAARVERLSLRMGDKGRPRTARIADEIELALIADEMGPSSVRPSVDDIRKYRALRRELRKRRRRSSDGTPPPRPGTLSVVDIDKLL